MQMEGLKELAQKVRQCNVCKLEGHVVGTIIGDPDRVDLLCVGEAPGEEEMERGVPFCGSSGHIIRKLLAEQGLENYAMINVLKCHPPGNRAPQAQEINSCLSFLKQQIEYIQPKLILALDKTAHKALEAIGVEHKQVYHPAYLLHSGYPEDKYRSDLLTALTYLFEKSPETRPPQVPQIPQLHCHSDFSVGDSIRSPEDMAKVASDLGITHLALTDHGTMAGVYQFESACRKHGVQPIIGYEGYVMEGLGEDTKATFIITPQPRQANKRSGGTKTTWFVDVTFRRYHSSLDLGLVDEFPTADEAIALIAERFKEWVSGGKKKKEPNAIKKLREEGYTEFDYAFTGSQSEGPGKGHMTIWARSQEGWKNLVHFHNDAVVNHFKRKPLIPLQHLIEHAQGLAFGTACRGGLLFQKWIEDSEEAETWLLETHNKVLAAGGEIVIEIMPHPALELQHDFNRWAYALGLREGIPVIVTCDCHYTSLEERAPKVAAASIIYKDRALVQKEDYFPGNSYYYQNESEVIENLGLSIEEANNVIAATRVFAEDFDFSLPREFPTPKECVAHIDFRQLVDEKFEAFLERTGEKELEQMGGVQALHDRVEMEYQRITKSDFAWYFLIEYELCQRLDKAGILRGPGRGSASGSFISYILDITRINPITQKLLFERFLPEGRKDPPDFDLDVQKSRRQEAIQILGDIVGRQTAQISTYARWHEKLMIRDACWLKKIDQEAYETDKLSDEVAESIRMLTDQLDGHIRHKGIHAAGVVALPDIAETIPLTRVKKEGGGGLAIELELRDILELNIPKFDVLGLDTLDFIAEMLKPRTSVSEGIDLPAAMKQLDWELHQLSDQDISDMLVFARLYPYGIFQLGTQAGEQLMKEVPPEHFEDVVRIVALNRPGTRPLIDLYRKRRIEGEAYEAMQGTEDSYGLIIYQEQVLKALNIIFGMSMQEADQARRAISKKKLDKLQALEEGTLKDQLKDPAKKKQWDEILLWAGYGFNRSHAVAYAWVSLMTIFLKILDPALALATWMNIKTEGKERREILREADRMMIPLRRPSIIEPQLETTGDRGEIRMGLTCIKGIALKTGQQLMERLQSEKPLTDAKKKLFEATGCLDGREVEFKDYALIPLPHYKTVNSRSLAHMEEGEIMKAQVIIEATMQDFTVEDGSGIFRAKSQIPDLEDGFRNVLIYKGAYWYYILEELQAKEENGEKWHLKPIPRGQWRVGHIQGPFRSKAENDYFRMVIYNDFEAHECIAMDSEKIRPLRWLKSVPGIISVTHNGGKFFRVSDNGDVPLLAQDVFQNPRAHKFSIFDRPLEAYEED